jgi:phosphatidylglycerol lysyltransferase
VLWRKPIVVRGEEFALPSSGLAVGQMLSGTLDWLSAGAVLYMLLPTESQISFFGFFSIFMLAQIAGVISHIPGGLGVFETVIVHFLSPVVPVPSLLASLVLYRFVYYIGPLAGAAGLIGVNEALRRREHVRSIARILGQWLPGVVPIVLGWGTFVGGMVLLFSGATPGVHGRLAWLRDFLPLPVIELSHFFGSVAGAGLLVLARGIQRRLDIAYVASLLLLGAGILFSLLKGLDYEEALILAVMLAALLPCRRYFYRKSALVEERFSRAWIVAVMAVLLASVWLTFFSYKRVEYSSDLWWHFAFRADAPRSLRAGVGALTVLLMFALRHLLRPAPRIPELPGPIDREDSRAIAAEYPYTYSWLATVGDKYLLFNDARTAFVMYQIEGRSWVAMGDPVAAPEDAAELVWRFRELCERQDAWPVFYQVSQDKLPLYIDLGLTLTKLGEEARILLENFALEGRDNKNLRHTHRGPVDAGCTFELVPQGDAAALIPELKPVSDAWLESKNTREKGFSLGYFAEDYLRHFPIAVVRVKGEIVAFANVWLGGEKEEISLDLMRNRKDAPDGVTDFMLIELMLWGKREGYRWFNLGMAPLSGLGEHALRPLWSRVGAFVFRYGENFYNFRGLRRYKEKFRPVWSPRYLASPGGFALPVIATNLATLIAGGIKGVISK